MSIEKKHIRPIALFFIEHRGKHLVIRGRDNKKDEEFYRPIGGGIEYGESGKEALIREVKEEVNAEIKNISFIDVLENIFIYEGEPGHEIAFIYKADFVDDNFYQHEKLKILDNVKNEWCFWVDKETLIQSKFYPDGIKKYLTTKDK